VSALKRLAEVRAMPMRRVVGLMTGTSMDGLDIAWCRIASGPRPTVELLDFVAAPFPAELRRRLEAAPDAATAELARLDMALGRFMAEAVLTAQRRHGIEVDLVGSHGQTVWHEHRETTLQIGDPGPLAAALRCPVVADFRRNDLAVGGCGAPLVPRFDELVLAEPERSIVALNIGGIANLASLPPLGGDTVGVIGFDCGPGNMVIDALARLATGGRLAMDVDGALAAAGEVQPALLEVLLGHRFFALPPPRSAGREQFGPAWAQELARACAPADRRGWCDLIATVTELTVAAIEMAYRRHVAPRRPAQRFVVSGGGARNPVLMRRLVARLAPIEVVPIDQLGLPGDAKEAVAFALLASLRVDGLPGNVPAVTGATGPVLLGRITELG
jgi:anhydro-N-acetylmuramic acid kinase